MTAKSPCHRIWEWNPPAKARILLITKAIKGMQLPVMITRILEMCQEAEVSTHLLRVRIARLAQLWRHSQINYSTMTLRNKWNYKTISEKKECRWPTNLIKYLNRTTSLKTLCHNKMNKRIKIALNNLMIQSKDLMIIKKMNKLTMKKMTKIMIMTQINTMKISTN